MTDIYLEQTDKKTFACALSWPGWCRNGKTEAAAIQALHDYAPRYRIIANQAELLFTPDEFIVVEHVHGNANTTFGAPSIIVTADTRPTDAVQAKHGVALLQAAWALLDTVVAAAPQELRKGPRGGGRDRDEITRHVTEAEREYARKIGIKQKPFSYDDRKALAVLRTEIIEVLSEPSDGAPLTPRGWPASYALRRITWHTLDHLWEIEDRQP